MIKWFAIILCLTVPHPLDHVTEGRFETRYIFLALYYFIKDAVNENGNYLGSLAPNNGLNI